MSIVLVRKLAFGAIVGFAQKETGGIEALQLALLIVVELVYLALLLGLRPYLDHLHMFLDAITTGGHVIVLAVMFSFVEGAVKDSTTHLIISVLIIIFLLLLYVVCIAVFINSWIKMKNIHSFGQFLNRLRGVDDANDPSKDKGLRSETEVEMVEDKLD